MTARVTSIQLLPVRKPRKVSIFSLYNKTFLLLNVRCEAKGNVSFGIKGLVILLKAALSRVRLSVKAEKLFARSRYDSY